MYTTQTSYKMPSAFANQREFMKYFRQLTLEVQLEMANANIPIAQRAIAAHFHDKEDFVNSQYWWQKAAHNKDPIALLHQGEVALLVPDLKAGEQYYQSLLEVINEIPNKEDTDFINFIKKNADLLRKKLIIELFKIGLEQFHNKDIDAALNSWKHGMELGEPAAAYNVARIEKKRGNIQGAVYALKLCLFYSNESTHSNNLRAAAHNMLAVIKLEASPNSSYVSGDFLKILTHLHRAEAYGSEDAKKSKDILLESLEGGDGLKKFILIKGLTPMHYQNGMIKTASQAFAKPNMTKEQCDKWLQYHDPRLKPEKYGITFLKKPNLANSNNNSDSHQCLLLDAEMICNHKDYDSFIKAIEEKKYSLALRKASAVGLLPLVNIILKYKVDLDIDINERSSSNGWTALDWIEHAEDLDETVKTSIVTTLLEHGAKCSGEELKI